MLQVFSATLGAMLTMLICMLVGFVLGKKHIEPAGTDSVLSKLLNFALAPALTFHTFFKNFNLSTLSQNYNLILYSCLIMVVAIVLAAPLSGLFIKKGYGRNVYKYAIAFANYGYMGDAIILALFGDQILFYYMLFKIPMQIVTYSWGMAQLIPGKKGFKGTFVRIVNPNTLALVLGIIAGLLNLKAYTPVFLTDALQSLGKCMGPIAMVLTGFVVSNFDTKKMLSNGKVYAVSFLRLLVLPALYCALLFFAGADRQTMVLTLVAYAAPLGLNTVVFPAAYGADTSIGAGMALISNALAILTFPLMYALLSIII